MNLDDKKLRSSLPRITRCHCATCRTGFNVLSMGQMHQILDTCQHLYMFWYMAEAGMRKAKERRARDSLPGERPASAARTGADPEYASSLFALQFSQVVLYGFRFDERRAWKQFPSDQALPQCGGAALSGG